MTNPKEKPLEFIEFLNRYLPWLDTQIPTDINSGGCAVFALILYNVVVALGFSPVIIALFDSHHGDKNASDIELKNFNEAVKQSNITSDVGPSHVLLRLFKDLYVDSTGIISTGRIEYLNAIEPISLEVLTRISTGIEWNSEYDKELTPQIKALLEAIPQEFENYLNGKEFPLPTERTRVTPHTAQERSKHDGMEGVMEQLLNAIGKE